MKRQTSFNDTTAAALYLVATPIGNLEELTPRAEAILKSVKYIACEDTRNSKKLLAYYNIHAKLLAYHNFNEAQSTKGIIELIKGGESVALISDAGYPLLSDPGYTLVQQAIKNDIPVIALSGANAALNALVVSGLNTRHYLFYGFLNAKEHALKAELEALKHLPYTLIFYEAPHRISKTLRLLWEVLGDRRAVIARELTKIHEEIIRGTLSELSQIADLKGEIVLLVSGEKNDEEVYDYDELLKVIDEHIAAGLKVKDAISEVAKDHKLSKNQLYNYYHQKRIN